MKKVDDAFLEALKKNPIYSKLNVDAEFGKAQGWILAHPNRRLTQRFFVGWLNRAVTNNNLDIPDDNAKALKCWEKIVVLASKGILLDRVRFQLEKEEIITACVVECGGMMEIMRADKGRLTTLKKRFINKFLELKGNPCKK